MAQVKLLTVALVSGARFVLVKRTDSTGDWYVLDTERGIVAGNDPYLELNTTDVEVTSTTGLTLLQWLHRNVTTINASEALHLLRNSITQENTTCMLKSMVEQ